MNVYLKTGLTLLIGFSASAILEKIVAKGQSKFYSHKLSRTKELFSSNTRYDILYLGSSRSHTTIRPSIVDSVTGLSSYNGGMDAGNLFEFKMTLDGFLASHPVPRLLVLTIDPNSFDLERKVYFPMQYYREFNNPAIRNAFREVKGQNVFFIRYLPFLRLIYYDDWLKTQALRGFAGGNEFPGKEFFEDKGYLSLGYHCMDSFSYHPTGIGKISKEGLLKLQEMIDVCKSKGIRVLLTFAPEYNRYYQSLFSNFTQFIKTVDSVARRNNLDFYREDTLALCKDSCMFVNYNHVNAAGAIEYSRILGQRIAGLPGIKTNQ